MAVTTRVDLYINPETTEPEEIVKTKAVIYEFDVLDNDQSLRDVSADTIEASSKDSGGNAVTWTVTKVDAANGRISISLTGVQTSSLDTGTITIDLYVNGAPRRLMDANVVTSESL